MFIFFVVHAYNGSSFFIVFSFTMLVSLNQQPYQLLTTLVINKLCVGRGTSLDGLPIVFAPLGSDIDDVGNRLCTVLGVCFGN